MTRYWNDKASTDAAFTSDGWLRTGDVGMFTPSGALLLKGRLKDMIKSGGENIYPTEIEAVLMQHPDVHDVVVIGIPDSRLGEALCAVIVLAPQVSWQTHPSIRSFFTGPLPAAPKRALSPLDLRTHCLDSGLSGFKLPRMFAAQCAPLPRSSTGKILRRDVQRHIIVEVRGGRGVSPLSKL